MAYLNRCTKSVLIVTCALALGVLLLAFMSYDDSLATRKSWILQRGFFAVNEVDSGQPSISSMTQVNAKKASVSNLEKVVSSEVDPQPLSVFSMTQDEREKFQQEQVDKFCEKHQIRYLDLKHVWSSYLWINTKTQTMYCYVPKVGCTTLKALYYLAMGLVPKSMVNATYKESANFHYMSSQVTLGKLSASKRLDAVSTYYKFVMHRHPLERLVSGYRDKIESLPLQGVTISGWIRNIQHGTYKFVDPDGYKKWIAEGGKRPITIRFIDMVRFMLDPTSKGKFSNEHMQPFFTLCSPCQIRYNYYGNFKTFNEDAAVLVDKYGVGMDMLRSKYYNRNTTTDLLTHAYYDTLTDELKIGLVKRFALDLDFYYHIFPSERDNHMEILKINYTLPDTRP